MSSQGTDKESQFQVLSARVRHEDAEALRRRAEQDHRTVSGTLRMLIEQHIAEPEEMAA